jgi:hypothetical protein
MKRFLIGLLVLILVLTVSAVASIRYVEPEAALDLSYNEVPITANITEMIRSRQLGIVLSESELSDLLKKRLADNPRVAERVEIKGAKFELDGHQLLSDVHVVYDGKWDIGATLEFELAWEEPYIIARHIRTKIKSIDIPITTFQLQPFQIDTQALLPKHIGIRSVQFSGEQLLIELKLQL